MKAAQKIFGVVVYGTLVFFVLCYVVFARYGENVIRKFLHDHWDRSIEVDWDSLPLSDDELHRYQEGIQADDD